MDEDITSRNSVLLNRESSRNSPPSISRLPTEILEIIFILYAQAYHDQKHDHRSAGLFPHWINVSYVCRHWRDVALNCATLWTHLSVTSPRWMEELLARSKTAPLKLCSCSGCYNPLYFVSLERVKFHVGRIQTLHLELPCRNSHNNIFPKLFSPAPLLQHLSISSQWNYEYSKPGVRYSVLFCGETPALRTLKLTNCLVPWYSLKLSGLTTLNLDSIPAEVRQNITEFLTTLNGMPNLECLHLVRAFPSAAGFLSSATFDAFPKINLPHLSRLLIATFLSTVVAFLSCVNVPSETKLWLQCHSELDLPLHHCSSLASILARRLSATEDQEPSSPAIRTLVIHSGHTWSADKLTTSTRQRDFDCSDSIQRLSQQVEWHPNVPLHASLFADPLTETGGESYFISNLCLVPWTNVDVESLHIIRPPFLATVWSKILGHFPNLRYLKLSQGVMPDLASVLSHSPRGNTDTTGRDADPVLAPLLEEVELHDITLLATPQESNGMPLHLTDIRLLCDALSSRKESRGRLIMTRCAVTGCAGRKKILNMTGSWEGGNFRVIHSDFK